MAMSRKAQLTINDVARLAGVSKKTVSRVINDSPLLNRETRERVQRIIAEIGYVPNPQARALALRRNFLVGLLHDDRDPHLITGAQQGLFAALRDTEFGLIVHPVDRGGAAALDAVRHFLERQRPFGLILLPPIADDAALLNLCTDLGVRHIRLTSTPADSPTTSIAANDREAARGAVEHLLAAGHRRIALVGGPPAAAATRERRRGYQDALRARGIAIHPDLIVGGEDDFDTGIRAAEALFDRAPRPTAIFAISDLLAAGVLHATHRRGLAVPRDLSIVGFGDGAVAARRWPPLTTVHWPVAAMARAAARRLIGEAPDEAAPTDDTPPGAAPFAATLITHLSVGPPAA